MSQLFGVQLGRCDSESRSRTVKQWVGLVCALTACTPVASTVPFANAEPEGVEVYYYGAASSSPPDEAKIAEQKPSKMKRKRTVHVPRGLSRADFEEPPKPPKLPNELLSRGENSGSDAGARLAKATESPFIGEYKGTDTVEISLRGFPEEAQVDDQARMRVQLNEDQELEFVVIDTSSGDDLCVVSAVVPKEGNVATFKPTEGCFSGLLGIPLDTTVTSGTAKLAGEHLTELEVQFEVELELDTEVIQLSGKLDYTFEGERE